MRLRIIVFVVVSLVVASGASAEFGMIRPLMAPLKDGIGGGGGGNKSLPTKPEVVDPYPVCIPAPTVKDIAGKYELHTSFISSSEALKLGFNVGSLEANGNQMLMIQDYLKGKECLATDKKTKVLYGQSIRTIIKLSDWDTKLGLSFPVIAADATLNHKNHQLHVYSYGMENVKINDLLAGVSGKVFDVDTYSNFIKVQSDLIKLVDDKTTQKSVERLAIIPINQNINDYKTNVITAYALQQISNKSSCSKAKENLAKHNNGDLSDKSYEALVEDIYKNVSGTCDEGNPSKMSVLKAEEFLMGFVVKRSLF